MKVTIEVDDIELFATALNNAIAAYGEIVWSIFLGCQIPSKFDKLKELSFKKVEARQKCLKDIYRQVEQIELEYKQYAEGN